MAINTNQIASIIRDSTQLYLNSDDHIELKGITNNGAVIVSIGGALLTCPGRRESIKEHIKMSVREACPNVEDVIFENHLNSDLVCQALLILRKGNNLVGA